MKTIYSIDDISKMTMLSTRTIRNYIKLGLLNGSKTNGYWQFTSDDISKFMNNDYVTQSLNTKRNSLIYDYILNDCKSINSVCSIYDYPVENNVEAKSLYNKILKKINSNEYNNLKFSYVNVNIFLYKNWKIIMYNN